MFDFGCCGSPLPRKETPNTQPQTVFEVFGYYVPYCTTLVQMEKGEKNKQAKSVRSYIFRDCTPMSYNENKNKPGTVRVWTINTVLPAQTCEKNTPEKKKQEGRRFLFNRTRGSPWQMSYWYSVSPISGVVSMPSGLIATVFTPSS